MIALAHWSFENRRKVVALWVVVAVVIAGLSHAKTNHFSDNLSLPHTDSQAASALLATGFPRAAGESDQVVFVAGHGMTIHSPAVKSAATDALRRVARVPGVETVTSPFSKAGASHISHDGTIAFASVTWRQPPATLTSADARHLIDAARSADGRSLQVSLTGQDISNEEGSGAGLSEGVAVIAAFIVLLLIFGGSVLPALVPLITAALALITATSIIGLLSRVMSVATVSTDLAVLIGLGVGIDYGLFIISRHRSGVKAGLSYEQAAAQAISTSGRTVVFAGSTVCIALLGQFALGVSYLYGLSIACAVTVGLTMATSLTFLPALLGFLGPRVLSRRERAALAEHGPETEHAHGFWLRWARTVQSHRVLAGLAGLAVCALIALPVAHLRLGTADGSTDPSSDTTHHAYVALTRGFGPGFAGPLDVVARTPSPSARTRFDHLIATARRTRGVATVTPPTSSPDGRVAVATLYPTTSPQAAQTVDLVGRIRDTLIPRAEQGSDLAVHVGGQTATSIDFSHVLSGKLPLFIAIVVVLAFLLLLLVFRSLLIPLTAAVMSLISIVVGLGALSAVFNRGLGAKIIGVSVTSPISAFIPVLMFSVLFGLSTDYEIYLVSRIQEQWRRLRAGGDGGGDGAMTARDANDRATTVGQAVSGRIIVGAALIMILVFASFLLTGQRILQEFGFGLGFAVLVDALVIRNILVPAAMHLIGPGNWKLPRWLDRILPNVSVEDPRGATGAGAAMPDPPPAAI